MRDLTDQEIKDFDHQCQCSIGSDIPGGRYIEATVGELAAANIGTACGGPDSFIVLAAKKYHARRVRGYLIRDHEREYLIGMIAITMQTENTALKIEQLANIRFEDEADPSTSLNGFMIFEDE
jgi:hypothetical protein